MSAAELRSYDRYADLRVGQGVLYIYIYFYIYINTHKYTESYNKSTEPIKAVNILPLMRLEPIEAVNILLLMRLEPTTLATPPCTTPDIDATNCATETSPKKDVQEALILTTTDAVHVVYWFLLNEWHLFSSQVKA